MEVVVSLINVILVPDKKFILIKGFKYLSCK